MLVYIILGLFAITFIGLLLWFLVYCVSKYRVSKSPNREAMVWEGPMFLKLSEQELATATDNYSEYNLLGTGRSARVYWGTFPSGETVAIKLFRDPQEENKLNFKKRFLRECRTLGQIRHRNLVRIITAICNDNIIALILQFMSNGSLQQLLHQPLQDGRLMPLSLRTRLRFIKNIASALSYLHHDCSPPIIHGDVNPSNVLLDDEMTAHLSDFGIARILEPSRLAMSNKFNSSVGCTPPEYKGMEEPWKIDVYSFGVVVLEVLTRLKPRDKMLNEQSLCEWVSTALMNGREYWYPLIYRAHGQREISILNDAELSTLEQLLKMGVWCCHGQPQFRPTMREVEKLLIKIRGMKMRNQYSSKGAKMGFSLPWKGRLILQLNVLFLILPPFNLQLVVPRTLLILLSSMFI